MNHQATFQTGRIGMTFHTGLVLVWLIPVVAMAPDALWAMPWDAIPTAVDGIDRPTSPAGQSTTQTRRSLHRAADTLTRAANILEKDERLAVQYIRQAISILRHEVLAPLRLPEAEATSDSAAAAETPDGDRHPALSATGKTYLRTINDGPP